MGPTVPSSLNFPPEGEIGGDGDWKLEIMETSEAATSTWP